MNSNDWSEQNLKKKIPPPINNAFAYNPQRIVKESNFQTGIVKNSIRDNKIKALPAGKRISKTGKTYWESRANRSDVNTSFT